MQVSFTVLGHGPMVKFCHIGMVLICITSYNIQDTPGATADGRYGVTWAFAVPSGRLTCIDLY